MEYEIESETNLFDESTNPSLDHVADQFQPPQPRPDRPAERRRSQKAELIPEEEEQAV